MKERIDEAREMTHDRWVVNKLRALGSWYTKGLENGSHLRAGINSAPSLDALRQLITEFFGASPLMPYRLPAPKVELSRV